MNKERMKQLENKLEELKKNRMGYLEADMNAGARRVEKQIERVELEIEVLKLEDIKKELDIYKEVIRDYPEIQRKIKLLKEDKQ